MFSINKKDNNRNHPSPLSKKYLTVGGFVFINYDNIDLFVAIFLYYCPYVSIVFRYVQLEATVKKLVADYNKKIGSRSCKVFFELQVTYFFPIER